ncbi:MAG TPA: hypothetical protein GXX19_10680 [Syntrophomonadaceae bacterium]|nr:hypothetical protein [Syntrophomonadaceae bacterium]
MSKIKYLLFFCLLMLLGLGFAAVCNAEGQSADLKIAASGHHGSNDSISEKGLIVKLKPGEFSIKEADDREEVGDQENEEEYEDQKESVEEKVYGDGQNHDKDDGQKNDEDKNDEKGDKGKEGQDNEESVKEKVYDDGQKSNATGIKVFVKGKQLTFDVPPVIKDGRTLVPVRAVTEGMGATVSWDEATRTVTIVKDNVTVILKIGSKTVNVNGQEKLLDVPAQLQNSRTFVPLRLIGEAFNYNVQWDPNSQKVVVN